MAISRETQPVTSAPRTTRERATHERTVDRSRWVPSLGPGLIFGALSTVGLVVSMFLPWRDGAGHPSDIPVAFLFDRTTTSSDPSLLIVLVPLAVILAVGTLVPMGAGARIVAGLGTLIVAALFAYQLREALDAFGGASLGDALDSGFYVAAISGAVAFVSGLMPSGWVARRDVETETILDDGR